MIEKLVEFLINRYFANLTSVLIITNSSYASEISECYLKATRISFQNLTQKGHLVGLHWINVAALKNQSDFDEILLQHVDMGLEGYITILPRIMGFLYARWYASQNSFLRLKDKYFLFLSTNVTDVDILGHEILKIFPHHLLVLSTKHSAGLELWTQKFVGTEGNLDAVHLDTFFENGSFAQNIELFPNKLLDLQGRTVGLAAFTYVPYVASYLMPNGSGNLDFLDPNEPKRSILYTGTEAELVLTFCSLRNCIIKVATYGADNWGGVYENGSSDGIIGSVYRRETEIGIGAYYNWYDDIFETSYAIAKSGVTILGPAPSLYPGFMTIVLPFNKIIWSLIILSMFASSLVMHGIKYVSFQMDHRDKKKKSYFEHMASYRMTLLQIVAIFFQQSFAQTRLNRFAARFYLTTLLLAGMTLENTYSGQLKSLLTIPLFTDPVDTIEKFSSTNWNWAAPSPVWAFAVASSNISYEQIMAKKFEVYDYEKLINLSYTGRYGLALERLHGGTFGFGDFIKDGALNQMILMKDDLYFEWTRLFAYRGWPLMDEFNTYVLWCLEHGLYKYWESKHVSSLMDKKTLEILFSLATGHQDKFPPMPLTFANISGPLIALGIGYSMAFAILLLELLSYGIFKK